MATTIKVEVQQQPDISITLTPVQLTVNGTGGQASTQRFTQSTAATEWLWNHNLGYKPKPQVYNLAFIEIDAEITHVSDNQIRVRVNPAQPGYIFI